MTHRWYASVSSAPARRAQRVLPYAVSSPSLHVQILPVIKIKRVKAEASSPARPPPAKRVRKVIEDEDESSADDVPLSQSRTTNGAAKRERDSDDDKPLASKKKKTASARAIKKVESDVDDSDSEPIVKKKSAAKANDKATANGKAKQPPLKKRVRKVALESEEEDAMDVDVESEDDVKPAKKSAPKKAAAARKPKAKKESDDEATSGPATPAKQPSKGKAKAVNGEQSPKKKPKKEEEEEDVFKWWEEQEALGDGSQKWKTLEHAGVLFPPPYEPLPKSVKLRYNGKDVDLPPEGEEVARFFGEMIETEHAEDETFKKNFFKDFLRVLKAHPPRDGTSITELAKCDFRPMFEHFDATRKAKQGMSPAEKKAIKEKKDAVEAMFKTCMLDGRKEKVGNFRVEPPGLFRGRGKHPKKGCLKLRVNPQDITINIGEGVPVPKPSIGGDWAKVIHDNTVTWLATWKENINGNTKYVFLAPGSSLKGQSDMSKFEKARDLKQFVGQIRADYERDLKSKVMADRQRATTMYFIDVLALRAGNEKGEDEADTVGCCSLRCEHVTLERDATDQGEYVVFDFLGKDSIRYFNRVRVSPQVFKNVRIFKGDNKVDDDALFDRVTTTNLNKHLTSYMKGLTAKVFRTFNASSTFQRLLDAQDLRKKTVHEKIAAYTDANREVAILCNHQRAAPKTHDMTMGKLNEKLRGMKYDRRKLRHGLFTIDPKLKKKHPELAEPESDLENDWIAEYEDAQRKLTIEKAEKNFEKANEKAEADGKGKKDISELKAKIEAIDKEYDQLKKERGKEKHEFPKPKSADAVLALIEKQDAKIQAFKVQMNVREDNKTVSLGTSKINYLDPRITVAWCKKWDVPVEKLFNKSLLVKFPWAMGADDEWKF
ncbi:hypothetical protein BKA62DRAFT_609892 [Auriculariales sp. MPI-PUGE-AT-0066]|nr:hypothetical protein BKA62DRAFT_609892 [Auriculariales sp. MPI-PUGE-AT-0066]